MKIKVFDEVKSMGNGLKTTIIDYAPVILTAVGCISLIGGTVAACIRTSNLDDLKKNNFSQSIPDRIRDYYITCVKEATAVYKSNTELNTFIKKQIGEISNVNKDNDTGILDIFYKLMAFEPFKGYLSADLQENVLKTRAARNISEISRLLSRFSRLHGMHSITRANKVAFPEELFNVFFRYLFVDGLGEIQNMRRKAAYPS